MTALAQLPLWALYGGVAVLGAIFGSFISAMSYRMALELPVVKERSRCTSCKTALGARDLVPIFSWLCNRGRCRHCGAKVSSRYVLIEVTTALSFVGLFALKGVSVEYVLLAALAVCIITLIVTDLEHYIIPDEIQIAMGVIAIAYGVVMSKAPDGLLIGSAVFFGVGLVLHYGFYFLMGKHGLGFGDVKFLAVAGLFLGVEPLIPFLFASGVLGVLSAGLWRMAGQGKVFPFGPALALAMLLFILMPQLSADFWSLGRYGASL